MWYSYSGDHIAAELGFEKGYEHVLLPADAYLSFYKSDRKSQHGLRRCRDPCGIATAEIILPRNLVLKRDMNMFCCPPMHISRSINPIGKASMVCGDVGTHVV